MTPQKLKTSILNLAVQGKLVEQRSNEGTGAQVLLNNTKEIAKLPTPIQKSKIGKTCASIKEDELPFDVPSTWAFERFGNLVINCDSQRKPVTKSDRKTENAQYDYYGATGAIDKVDDFIFEGEYLMIGEDGGNFFVSRDNSFIANGKFWANNHVHVVKPIYCDIRYLKIFLDSCNFPNMGLIHGIAVPKLNQECLNSIVVSIPPLAEQHRIVAKIEELLPLIDRYEKAYCRLEDFNNRFPIDIQKSILQMAMQGKLSMQLSSDGDARDLLPSLKIDSKILPVESPFDIPNNWLWIPIGNLGASTDSDSFCDGPFGSNLKTIHYINKPEVRIIQLSNIGENGWRNKNVKYTSYKHLEEVIPRCEVHSGDFVIAKMMPAGRTIEVPDLGTRITLGSDAMRFVPNPILNKQFLLYAMSSQAFLSQVYAEAHGITRIRTTLKSVKSYVLPIPPLAEQQRIVDKLEEILPLCKKIQINQ